MVPNVEDMRASWERIAGEALELHQNGAELVAFGSELACLRLFYSHRLAPNKTDVIAKGGRFAFWWRHCF